MHSAQTQVIVARNVRRGHRLWHPMIAGGMVVRSVTTCNDGSLRIQTDVDEKRMTGSIQVRILN